MISPDRPEYEGWCSLTRELEKKGLYGETKRIGFKEYWDELLFVDCLLMEYQKQRKGAVFSFDGKLNKKIAPFTKPDPA